MAKFILLYRGPATPVEEITPELGKQIMDAWNAWMGKVGEAVVDGGAPFAGRTGVSGDGSSADASDLNGYTVVEAAGIDAARSLCEGHPFLSEGTSEFVVEIYELVPM